MAASTWRLTPRARVDLAEIWDYTAETWSLEQAERYHANLIQAFERLSEEPLIGSDAGQIRSGYRRWPVGSHVIFHKARQDGVDVIRILHRSRDFPRHL